MIDVMKRECVCSVYYVYVLMVPYLRKEVCKVYVR